MKCKVLSLLLTGFLLVFISFGLCGCWDRIEIEDMLIIVGMAIDCSDDGNSLVITYQHVIPEGVGGGERTTPARKSPYANTSLEGTSFTETSEILHSIKSRRPNYEHLMVIILSDDVARNYDLYQLLNGILRHSEVPRNATILVSEGKARYFLDVEPNIEDIPSSNIMKISRDTKRKSGMPFVVKLGDLSEKMAAGKSIAVQRIATRDSIQLAIDATATGTGYVKEDVYEVRGAAVIRGNPCILAGWLDEKETDGINWIMGKGDSGVVQGRHEDTGEIVVFRIRSAKTKIKPYMSGGDVSFIIECEMEGSITEDWSIGVSSFDEEYIEKVEMVVKKEVEKTMHRAINKIQKELNTDVVDFGKKVQIKYPSAWEKIKGDWESIFRDADIDLKVEINIREFERKGMTK